MEVWRGRYPDVDADSAATSEVVERVADGNAESAVRVWNPPRHVAFGRRDRTASGYEAAREWAQSHGFEPVERSVGGRAVVVTEGVLSFVLAEPADASATGIEDRYETVTERLLSGLASLGITAERGEPPNSFCPGTHSLQAGGKIAGLAQRVRRDVAVTSGVLVVDDAAELASALGPIYAALEVPFDPDSVGSLADAAPADARPVDRENVRSAVEGALVGSATPTVRDVRET